MTKREIIAAFAQERGVETIVMNIAHSALTDDLRDLVQMVYVILLETDEDKIQDLDARGQMNFFVARIVCNQFRSGHSPWHDLIRKPREMSEDIGQLNIIDEG